MARQTVEDALRQSLPYAEAIAELKRVNFHLDRIATTLAMLHSLLAIRDNKSWWKRMFGL